MRSNLVKIGNRIIGSGRTPLIIAEAGVNHNGKLSLAKRLVDAAKKAGADIVKFQTFRAADVVIKSAGLADYQKRNLGKSESQLDMLKKLELSDSDFRKLKRHCDRKGIMFMSTPHTLQSIHLVNQLSPAFKVASGDLTNHYFLKKLALTKKPIILSTGMSSMAEVKAAVRVIEAAGNRKIILLHCTSNYPCPPQEVNLRAMTTMMKTFPYPVGYSDHTLGLQVSIMAATQGACVIEKHFTLSKKMAGPDHRASLEPKELGELVKAIRLVPVILGRAEKKPTASELKTAKVARKSVVAIYAIRQGEKFSARNLGIKRPGTGMAPRYFESLLGRKARRDIAADTLISKNDYA